MYAAEFFLNRIVKIDRITGEVIEYLDTNVAVGPFDAMPGFDTPYGNTPNGMGVLLKGDIIYIIQDLAFNGPGFLGRENGSINLVDGKAFKHIARYPLIGVAGQRMSGHNLLLTPNGQYVVIGGFGRPSDAALLVYRVHDLYKGDYTPSWTAAFTDPNFIYDQPYLTTFPQYAGNNLAIRSMAMSIDPEDGSLDKIYVSLGDL